MKNLTRWSVALMFVATFVVTSCRDQDSINAVAPYQTGIEQIDELRSEFGLLFAKALADKEVRIFIKNEAAKQFDGDDDVLYAVAKDKVLSDGLTLEKHLLKYSASGRDLSKFSALPLLTIFIPNTVDFSIEKWDINTQIPIVAVVTSDYREKTHNKVWAYSHDGRKEELVTSDTPKLPVLVIKDNERLVAQSLSSNARQITSTEKLGGSLYYTSKTHAFYFIGNISGENKAQGRLAADYVTPDQSVIDAFDKNLESHRDYVYYSIDPSQGINQGEFKRNYTEFLEKIRFTDIGALQNVTSDWTEGNLEFRLTHLWVNRNGDLQSDPKTFYCAPPYYVDQNGNKQVGDYHPHVELRPWNMQDYGDEWKIVISEYDPAGTTSKTVTVESTFGFNFEADFTILKKGIKFGANGTMKKTTSATITSTEASDDLGSASIFFSDPIIVNRVYNNFFNIYERGTGSILLSLQPFRTY